MKYEIWTDGSTLRNPGPGGYAWLALGKIPLDKCREGFGAEPYTTSNRMELQAAIDAIETLLVTTSGDLEVKIHSDSEYLVKGMNGRVQKWKGEFKNKDLWEKLLVLVSTVKAEFIWIKGHSGIAENEYVDKLAYKAVKNAYGRISRGR